MKLEEFLLTEKLLVDIDACSNAIDFVKRNNLIGFPLKRFDEIEGDYNFYIKWLNSCFIQEFDLEYNNDNLILLKTDSDFEKRHYDDKGNLILIELYHNDETKFFVDFWKKIKYDNHKNIIRIEENNGKIEKRYYDDVGNLIYITKTPSFDGIKQFWVKNQYDLKRNLIFTENSEDYWEKMEYDSIGNVISVKTSEGYWKKKEYDQFNNLVFSENSDGIINIMKYDSHRNLIYDETTEDGVVYKLEHKTSFYDNDQLKSIGYLKIPKF